MGDPATAEGYVEVPGGRVWYQIVGADRPGVPVLCLHGGPGMPHDYLEPLADLAASQAGDLLRSARLRPVGPARGRLAVDRRPVRRGTGRGPGRARARAPAPVRQLLGRLARPAVHPRSQAPARKPDPQQLATQRLALDQPTVRSCAPNSTNRSVTCSTATRRAAISPAPNTNGRSRSSTGGTCAGRTPGRGRGADLRRHGRRRLPDHVGTERVRPGHRPPARLGRDRPAR